jgi:DtxR family transcriptional regulator, Mn-dependent transcriptional regulator
MIIFAPMKALYSQAEENYLKAIFKLSEEENVPLHTNAIAAVIGVKSASVTDMLRKLADKKLLRYQRYYGVQLTDKGRLAAVMVIRKHRLWEYFLVEKLGYGWAEVHEIAEQLEHISSDSLVDRLDAFLGHPRSDPHGDPIPDRDGKITPVSTLRLSGAEKGKRYMFTGVSDHTVEFLNYLGKLGLNLGCEITVKEIVEYDRSMEIMANGKEKHLSQAVSNAIMITPAAAVKKKK